MICSSKKKVMKIIPYLALFSLFVFSIFFWCLLLLDFFLLLVAISHSHQFFTFLLEATEEDLAELEPELVIPRHLVSVDFVLFDGTFTSSPRSVSDVDDGVDHQENVTGGKAQQVPHTVHQLQTFATVQKSCGCEQTDQEEQEKGWRCQLKLEYLQQGVVHCVKIHDLVWLWELFYIQGGW